MPAAAAKATRRPAAIVYGARARSSARARGHSRAANQQARTPIASPAMNQIILMTCLPGGRGLLSAERPTYTYALRA